MATCFGWTWEYIDECVTLPRLYEIWHAWQKTPPLHIAFAGFVGAFPKERTPSTPAADGKDDLVRDLGAAGVGAMPTLPPELLAMLTE